MKKNQITRRHFVTSGLFAGVASTFFPGKALAFSQDGSEQKILKDPSAIISLLKKRLPNAKLDEQSLNNYAADLIRGIEIERDSNSALYKSILKSKSKQDQLEHFIVQDFLLKSDALMSAHLKKPVTY